MIQKAVINKSTSWVPQGSFLGTIMLKDFLNHLEEVMELTLINTADDTKLGN